MQPREAADALITKYDIRCAHEIKIDLLAYAEGACVLWRDAVGADARVTRSGGTAYIAVPKQARGTPRSRFSIAHDLAHHLLHRDFDAIARVHGLPRSEGWEFKCEHEANEFGRHVLVPTSIAAPMCETSRPELARVIELAGAFDVSLTVAARRWAEMSPSSCAFVEAQGGVITWATRSRAFRGEAVKGRVLPDGALALDHTCGWSRGERKRAHRVAWGAGQAGRDVIEECVRLYGGRMLVWLWQE